MDLLFSVNDTYKCWERKNVSITINDLPSLLKNFMICLDMCHTLKNNEYFMVTSQLKSSMSVLRDLYYHGKISFLVSIMISKYLGAK